jgi:outer membrane lipoprotein LolB
MRVLILLLLSALAGCAAVPSRAPVDPGTWPARRDELQALSSWGLDGRIAVVTAAEGWSATLDWRQQGGLGELSVRGPLGAGAARVTVDGGRVRIEDGHGGVAETTDDDPEFIARLGAPLPISRLRYWVLGVPAPGDSAEETLGPDGRLLTLAQSGWRVRYDEYLNGAGGELPRRVVAEREGVRVKLVVERWRVPLEGAPP